MSKKNIFFICILFPFLVFSQKKGKDQYEIKFNSGIVIDADINDWADNLYHVGSDLWQFGLVMDKENLYATAIIKDNQLIGEAVRNGILLNISYSDKKKDGARLLFPRFNLEKLEGLLGEDSEGGSISNEDLIKSAKGYYVAGFSRVVDGLLSFDNQYGVQAKCRMDSLGTLIYEAKVPLNLVHFKTDKIAVQLAVNTRFSQLKRTVPNQTKSNVGGYYGRTIPSGASIKNPYKEDVEVWFWGVIK